MDLRNLPLDGFDMFLLTQLESTLSLQELLDVAPCDQDESIRRLHQLVDLKLVELQGAPGESLPKPRVAVAPKRMEKLEVPRVDFDDEDTSTLRPPPPAKPAPKSRVLAKAKVSLDDDAATLRPPAPLAVQDMMREADESTVQKVVERSSGVREKKTENVEFETPKQVVAADGRVVNDRSVFSRATLVDEDVQERARELMPEPLPRGRRA